MANDDYKAGESFGQVIGGLTGEIKILTVAIGELKTEFRMFKSGIGPSLEEHGNKLTALETNRANDKNHIISVSEKIEKHVDGHWKWITVLVGLLSILAVLFKFTMSHRG